MKPLQRQLAGLLLMCAGLALTTLALAMLWLAPQVFVATARVSVTPPQQQPAKAAAPGSSSTAELERIQAKVILYQVITNLDLQRKWAEQTKAEEPLPLDAAYQLLKKQLTVLQDKNSALTEIRVQSYSAVEASTLANRIAETYRDTVRADGTAVQIVESALPPPKGRRSGGSKAFAVFLAGLAVLGVGCWVQFSAGLLGPASPK